MMEYDNEITRIKHRSAVGLIRAGTIMIQGGSKAGIMTLSQLSTGAGIVMTIIEAGTANTLGQGVTIHYVNDDAFNLSNYDPLVIVGSALGGATGGRVFLGLNARIGIGDKIAKPSLEAGSRVIQPYGSKIFETVGSGAGGAIGEMTGDLMGQTGVRPWGCEQ